MRRAPYITRRRHAGARGFTLIEILIVGALIALFAGLAIVGAQQLYDSNRAKAMQGEVYQVGTALSWAYTDLGFHPKLSLLTLPLNQWAGNPHIYGANVGTGRLATAAENFNGPYLSVSESRNRQAQGRFGIVEMTILGVDLPDGNNRTFEWPTDTWGNPYMLYLVTNNETGGLRLTEGPGENPDVLAGVISYGPNNLPGGNERTLVEPEGTTYATETLFPAMLYFVTQEQLRFQGATRVLKSLNSTTPDLQLNSDQFIDDFTESLRAPSPNVNAGRVGILDEGTDDIIFRF